MVSDNGPLFPCTVAVTAAVPCAKASSNPPAVILATVVSLLLHATVWPVMEFPSASVTEADSCAKSPAVGGGMDAMATALGTWTQLTEMLATFVVVTVPAPSATSQVPFTGWVCTVTE